LQFGEDNLVNKKPTNPKKFTESYQMIQDLFQEPVSRRSLWLSFSVRILKGALVLTGAACSLLVLYILIVYDLTAISVVDGGISIPKR
jgi:hypothetical protein